ncbi:hypothetical protein CEXT_537211 [Caerostris extrusa]|uniref:Uncharacterized protein n=1 Tax=Caerostris extrusa TaxID=172846 RepID=A0AAV4S2D6_CAEEX|nr:hypothetical protein CEXT_537211 [Caerostris extrusa]
MRPHTRLLFPLPRLRFSVSCDPILLVDVLKMKVDGRSLLSSAGFLLTSHDTFSPFASSFYVYIARLLSLSVAISRFFEKVVPKFSTNLCPLTTLPEEIGSDSLRVHYVFRGRFCVKFFHDVRCAIVSDNFSSDDSLVLVDIRVWISGYVVCGRSGLSERRDPGMYLQLVSSFNFIMLRRNGGHDSRGVSVKGILEKCCYCADAVVDSAAFELSIIGLS